MFSFVGARTAKNGVTCVFCRAKWADATVAGGAGGSGATISEGYLNLGAAAGVDLTRDTSTCKCRIG